MGDDAPIPMATAAELADLNAGIFRRGTEEFSRLVGFSDGVFGFAMTLLISTVAIPVVQSHELDDALIDNIPDLVSYFVSFAVIGYYWLAHHRLVAAVGAVTTRLLRMNLVFLALIAFMPFPTALFGRYTDVPVTVVVYASALSLASLVEVAIIREARRSGCLRVPLSDDAYRYVILAALAPVAVFALSVVVAGLAVGWAPMVWLGIIPIEWLIGRRSPVPSRLFG